MVVGNMLIHNVLCDSLIKTQNQLEELRKRKDLEVMELQMKIKHLEMVNSILEKHYKDTQLDRDYVVKIYK